jgi:hypothetical protein
MSDESSFGLRFLPLFPAALAFGFVGEDTFVEAGCACEPDQLK